MIKFSTIITIVTINITHLGCIVSDEELRHLRLTSSGHCVCQCPSIILEWIQF